MLATGCMVCLSVCNSYCCLVHLSVEQCVCVADCLIYTIIRDSIILRVCLQDVDQIREVLTDSGYDVELAIVTLLQIMELKENGSITFTYLPNCEILFKSSPNQLFTMTHLYHLDYMHCFYKYETVEIDNVHNIHV